MMPGRCLLLYLLLSSWCACTNARLLGFRRCSSSSPDRSLRSVVSVRGGGLGGLLGRLNPLGWGRRGGRSVANGEDAAKEFGEFFDGLVGSGGEETAETAGDELQETVEWHGGSLAQAQESALRSQKFLLVFVHSERFRKEGLEFMRETLRDPEVAMELNDKYVCWGGLPSHPYVKRLVNKTLKPKNRKKPYLSLWHVPVVPPSPDAVGGSRGRRGLKPEVLCVHPWRHTPTPRQLLGWLRKAETFFGGRLDADRDHFERGIAERALRREQRAAFERAKHTDRRRETEERAASALEKLRLEYEALLEDSLVVSSGDTEGELEGEGTVHLFVRLPDGRRLEGRFRRSAPVGTVFVWVHRALQGLQQQGESLGSSIAAFHLVQRDGGPRQGVEGPSLAFSLEERKNLGKGVCEVLQPTEESREEGDEETCVLFLRMRGRGR
uniref:UBX domain-containing protein n=1 Tax=Chromera velia CCMP2878 TaxID=1169474 RepID=A0A0G4HEA1_9ALVE|eukprot:Cvel_26602.t1-p1 / transcript=Cvel_26602.t1 / gene=Cvel_26602 / organism=Chromera_velia_CCMP2878 / gene_product=hypothetical protein / transcript_product=hypothetical protein / location=Cvel_scaffold3189:14450-16974(-) / protein_length=438 / sequence_SO=supercontig / SO=protein_coding / is_pseudo=false